MKKRQSWKTGWTRSSLSAFLLWPLFLLCAFWSGSAAQAQGTNAGTVASWARDEVIYEVTPYNGEKLIALTFDDGPLPGSTERFLDVLAQYGVKATFFQMGANLSPNQALGRRVRDAGHAIGNHTWSHLTTPGDPVGEVTRTDALFQSVYGGPTALFRPPFGNLDNGVATQALAQHDAVIMWSVDPKDWNTPGTSSIVNTVINGATPGGIVLLHDGGGDRSQTIAALPQIITTLRSRGYRFVTVPELLAARDAPIGTPTPTPLPPPTPSPQNGDGLKGDYYNALEFGGTPITRIDKQINFDWRKKAPFSGLTAGRFSVRWTGQIQAPNSQTYTFWLRASDGVRLWVDGRLLINRWSKGQATNSATIALQAGKRVDIRIEYFEDGKDANVRLEWGTPTMDHRVVPQSALFSSAPAPIPTPVPTAVPTPTSAPANNPTLQIDTPIATYSYETFPAATGRVTDGGGGLSGVAALLYRYSDDSYWNGTAWGTAIVETPATFAVDVSNAKAWNWSFALPTLSDGHYSFQVVARDAGTNPRLETRSSWTPFFIDSQAPTPQILSPANNGIYSSVGAVQGLAFDSAAGVQAVFVNLIRASDGAQWNGNSWSTTASDLTATLSNPSYQANGVNVAWSLNLPTLPIGAYQIQVRARDYYGHLSVPVSADFSIASGAPPGLVRVLPTYNLPPALLSAAKFDIENNGLRLFFATPLNAKTIGTPHFEAWQNGQSIGVESATYRAGDNSVLLEFGDDLQRGAVLRVGWHALRHRNGSLLRDGGGQTFVR